MANEPINAALYRYHIQKIAKACRPALLVEVGVYAGDLSRLLLSIGSVKRLVLVDPWLEVPGWRDTAHMELLAQSVLTWAKTDSRVEILRESSVEAAKRFEDGAVDFWHLDGDHSYEAVRSDLQSWHPKMRKGGLMTGDNYEAPSVWKAVQEVLGKVQLEGSGRIWFTRT